MLVGYLNIARALDKKIAVLESILNVECFDVFGVGETDLLPDSIAPTLEGYSTIEHRNNDGISRLCVYVKHSITIEETICLKEHPAIILQLAQISIAFAYNGFTLNPYTDVKKRLSEKERCNNAIDILDQIQFVSKKGLIIQGDFNIDYLSDTISMRRLANWALDSDCLQCITSPTRSTSCLDLCYYRLNNPKLSASSFDAHISDHDAIKVRFGRSKPKQVKRSFIKWSFTNEIREYAQSHLLKIDELLTCEIEECALKLVHWLQNLNEMASRKVNVSTSSACKKWYTPELRAMKKNLALANREDRRSLRNAYTKKLRIARRNHERKLAESMKGGVWDVLKKKDRSDVTWEMEIEGHTTKDCSTIASAFKDTFVNKV